MNITYCDKCRNEIKGMIEKQEMYVINLRGGYGSVFGDGDTVYIELCQGCLYDILKKEDLLNETTHRRNNWV